MRREPAECTARERKIMNEDKPVGRGVTGRVASSWQSAWARRRTAEVPRGQSSQQRYDRRAVGAYRVAVAALLVALTAANFVAFGLEKFRLDNERVDRGCCRRLSSVLRGDARDCLLSRNSARKEYAPGSGQRLTWLGRLFSVIPIWGLIQISAFPGVNRLTKRRLRVRNVAITAGSALVWSSWNDLRRPVAGSVAMVVLQVTGIVLAVLMSRKIPATGLPEARKAGTSTRMQPRLTAEMPGDSAS